MTTAPEILALEQLRRLCLGQVEALSEALEDMDQRRFSAADLTHLNKADRRLLSQSCRNDRKKLLQEASPRGREHLCEGIYRSCESVIVRMRPYRETK